MFTPDDLVRLIEENKNVHGPEFTPSAAAATCNARTRPEWHSTSDTYKQNYVNAVKCLFNRPSKGYDGSKNRYEDFVQVHQTVADSVHNNRKFLPWHRALLWAYEKALQDECGFTEMVPWFDETKYAGRFSQSSVFSSKWFGGINLGGDCVRDGQFANLALNIGPGTGRQRYCLSRNGNAADTKMCNAETVQNCRQATDYQVFALCEEGGIHAYGHNGIGGVMRDFYSSPGDPVFWLHHAMVDRHFRVWQNDDPNRVNYIDGTGPDGKGLTMDTPIYLNGLKPDLRIRDVMNTLGGFLCYRYDY
ncbi:Di-copper centre-containing protein [Bimuria novae-zelandiae CBS 107.79]|uniref:Di-copper centre-containing protein n=1 Tax=Bimuria novae-zelandiae CBS 107.79 TaxID=1447943 RepID=A0A6A5VIY0_9PLEO|nr:Di-copper centre-containing protein [Bimuria novae-zelandiae CBS 107.79]